MEEKEQLRLFVKEAREMAAESAIKRESHAETFRRVWEFYKLNKVETKED